MGGTRIGVGGPHIRAGLVRGLECSWGPATPDGWHVDTRIDGRSGTRAGAEWVARGSELGPRARHE